MAVWVQTNEANRGRFGLPIYPRAEITSVFKPKLNPSGSVPSVHSVQSVVKESSDHRVHGIHGMKRRFRVPESVRQRQLRALCVIRG